MVRTPREMKNGKCGDTLESRYAAATEKCFRINKEQELIRRQQQLLRRQQHLLRTVINLYKREKKLCISSSEVFLRKIENTIDDFSGRQYAHKWYLYNY